MPSSTLNGVQALAASNPNKSKQVMNQLVTIEGHKVLIISIDFTDIDSGRVPVEFAVDGIDLQDEAAFQYWGRAVNEYIGKALDDFAKTHQDL